MDHYFADRDRRAVCVIDDKVELVVSYTKHQFVVELKAKPHKFSVQLTEVPSVRILFDSENPSSHKEMLVKI